MLGNNGGKIGVMGAPSAASGASGIYLPNEQSIAKRAGQWPLGPNEVPAIGAAFEGGFFAGYISHTANGVPTHALIVSPRSAASGTGYTTTTLYQYKTVTTDTVNTYSTFDGASNQAAMIAAGIANHPAADYCENLTTNGYTDWYLPARFEQEIAYFNLKPTTDSNFTGTNGGNNPYAVPARNFSYTAGNPAQTIATAFMSGGSQAFSTDRQHWTSTRFDNISCRSFFYQTGESQTFSWATDNFNVRAFRKVAL